MSQLSLNIPRPLALFSLIWYPCLSLLFQLTTRGEHAMGDHCKSSLRVSFVCTPTRVFESSNSTFYWTVPVFFRCAQMLNGKINKTTLGSRLSVERAAIFTLLDEVGDLFSLSANWHYSSAQIMPNILPVTWPGPAGEREFFSFVMLFDTKAKK